MGRRRREVIIETERVLQISSRTGRSIHWCDLCSRQMPMLTVEEAAAMMGVSTDEILRKMMDDELHFLQTPGKIVRICPNSLLV